MSPLEYPDRHHLHAAAGWLELGNAAEAEAELLQLSPAGRDHPEVLNLGWHVRADRHEWESALKLAQQHVALEPGSPTAWIHQSFALHELQRTDDAYRQLRQVADRFNEEGTIAYNLACYTCKLGRLDEARDWLVKARSVFGRKELLKMAAEDPDLEALRAELKSL